MSASASICQQSGPPEARAAGLSRGLGLCPMLCTAGAAALLAACAVPGIAQDRAPVAAAPAGAEPSAPELSYAQLVELGRASEMVLVAAIADQAEVKAERAPGLAPGQARLYLEADTESLLAGPSAIGGAIRFLADRDRDARGRAPKLKGQRFLLFARAVPGRPGEIQLISPAAMLPAAPGLVERTRAVLRQFAEARPLPEITGVREVISIAGNLAGESETQVFLATKAGEPVSMTVLRRPGMAPEWGVSWTDIVDPAARPPEPETLEWYRLACFLPDALPDAAFLQEEAEARSRARADYAFVLEALGPCGRDSA